MKIFRLNALKITNVKCEYAHYQHQPMNIDHSHKKIQTHKNSHKIIQNFLHKIYKSYRSSRVNSDFNPLINYYQLGACLVFTICYQN